MAKKISTNQQDQDIAKKHDPLVRLALSDLNIAREFLNLYLDSRIYKLCDFKTLEIVSGAYIETNLKTYYADIVFKVDLKDKSAGSAYIGLILEHQSIPKKFMPLRILRYQVEMLQQHVEKHGENTPLPLVVAIVYYNGKEPYTYPTDLSQLFANQELNCKAYLGKFDLANITGMDETEILEHKKLAAIEMALKHIHDLDFRPASNMMFEALRASHREGISLNLIEALITYLADGRKQSVVNHYLLKFNKLQITGR